MSPITLPLTWRASTKRALVLLFASIGFVAVGLAIAAEHPVIGYGNVAFFGACSGIALVMLHPRAHYLTLSTEGFEFAAMFRAHRVRWRDVTAFRPVRIGLNDLVGWSYAESFKDHARLRAVNQALTGADAALPDTYGQSAEELSRIMESLRRTYGADAP